MKEPIIIKQDDLVSVSTVHDETIVEGVGKHIEQAKKDWYTYNVKWEEDPVFTASYGSGSTLVPWAIPPSPTQPKTNWYSPQAKEAQESGVPDHKNVYLHLNNLCICGETGGSHMSGQPYDCLYTGCKGFIFAETDVLKKMTTKTKSDVPTTPDIPPDSVLKLVPGSVPEDWHRHINRIKNTGGWVYKTAKIHPEATVLADAVVYGNVIIKSSAYVYENAKVFGDAVIYSGCYIKGHAKVGGSAVVEKYCAISGYSKIFGHIETSCNISGKTHIKAGTVVSAGTILESTPTQSRTQKANGLTALKTSGFDVPASKIYKIERLKTKKQLESLIGNFVRPCPITPRHGFVDSRSVATLDDAKAIVKETKLADAEAEFIVMPFIKASHSGVWTEGQLSIGMGNDGATSGRDSWNIPIQGVPKSNKTPDWNGFLKSAGITNSPYIELLWTKVGVIYNTQFVQLRDGPKLPISVNFIPKEITVTNIVIAEGDLLKWESDVKDFTPGTVVYHPGGSLASHYAVHAYLNNIPVLIDKEPKIGDVLKPDTKVLKSDISKMRKGFQIGCTLGCSYPDAAYLMMVGCHSTTQWLGRCDLFLGVAMGCCYRLLIAASLGEFRRRDSMILGKDGSFGSREGVYAQVWDTILDESIKTRFDSAMKSFDEEDWKGSSIGGVNWFILSRWGALIYNSLMDGDEKAALEALNKGVNSVHNGGWTFNKFISKEEMNKTAKDPVYALLKIAPLLYDSAKNNFIETQLQPKYEVKDIPDVEKYVKEHQQKTQKLISSPPTVKGKKCCSKDCCGNPDCTECHPVFLQNEHKPTVYSECVCQDQFSHEGKATWVYGGTSHDKFLIPACENHIKWYLNPTHDNGLLLEDVKYEVVKLQYQSCLYQGDISVHLGKEVLVKSIQLNFIFPVCEAHLDQYLPDTASFVLYKPESSSLSELKCKCGNHTCPDCYPDGCGCSCIDCHDDGCESCCGCDDHNCNICYPNGCDCSNTSCHDCKWDHCTGCNPEHDVNHCESCYGKSDGTCTDKNCEKCYPEIETETNETT